LRLDKLFGKSIIYETEQHFEEHENKLFNIILKTIHHVNHEFLWIIKYAYNTPGFSMGFHNGLYRKGLTYLRVINFRRSKEILCMM
jgi:hypothetical protein